MGSHDRQRATKAALISAVPPLMLKTAANPDVLPIEKFHEIRQGSNVDRSQFYEDPANGSSTDPPFISPSWGRQRSPAQPMWAEGITAILKA